MKKSIKLLPELFYGLETTERNAMLFFFFLKFRYRGIFNNYTIDGMAKATGISYNAVRRYMAVFEKMGIVHRAGKHLILHNIEKELVEEGQKFLKLYIYKTVTFDYFKSIMYNEIIRYYNNRQEFAASQKAIVKVSNEKSLKVDPKTYKKAKKNVSKYGLTGKTSSDVNNSYRQLSKTTGLPFGIIRKYIKINEKNGFIKAKQSLSRIGDMDYNSYSLMVSNTRENRGVFRYNKGTAYRHNGTRINQLISFNCK